ncbi:hypothetical protein ANO11243_035570 [Dothideomycetidae sp. 11243]|nr:hypothetical protein ANO11243_035570 [fungal sp. No.11243]
MSATTEPGNITELSSLTTALPPSCIAFSPVQHDHVVIGTYFLEQTSPTEANNAEPQVRKGSLLLFKLVNGALSQLDDLPLNSGILDIAFSPHDPTLLCAATSTGSLAFFRLTFSSLTPIHETQVTDPKVLVLDLVFHPTRRDTIGITLSTGSTSLIVLTPTFSISETIPIHTHSLEAWTLSFSPSGEALFSGADDATLHATPLSDISPTGQTIVDRRSHTAGVTAILPLSTTSKGSILLTGSYDDKLRVLRLVPGRRTQVLAELDLGGGVWRLQFLSESPGEWCVLASCMHAGVRIVRIHFDGWEGVVDGEGDGEWELDVIGRFEKHQSMNYGSDVVPSATDCGRRTVVSTSFYDRLVCVWEVDVPP